MFIGEYNKAVVLTYLSVVFGILGLSFAFSGNFMYAMICLLTAGVCDTFDGKVARSCERTEDGKRLEKHAMKKTMKGAVKDCISDFLARGVNADYNIYITHAGALEKAQKAAEQVKEAIEGVHIEILDLSPAFITQGGPGCVAIQCIKR